MEEEAEDTEERERDGSGMGAAIGEEEKGPGEFTKMPLLPILL